MDNILKSKKIIGCLLALMILALLMVSPGFVHGRSSSKDMIVIKTINGKYLCAEDGGGSKLVTDRDKIGEWETFEIINLGKGYVALKGNNGDYISVTKDGKDVHVNSNEINKAQILQLVKLNNGKVAFKTYRDTYICAENGGGGKVVADREKVGDWESFELIKVNDVKPVKFILTAKTSNDGITLSWNKVNDEKNIIGYNLYRATASGKQSSTPITDFPIQDTSYKDKNIENKTNYYYIVKAVYKDNSIGNASNEISIKSRLENRKILLEVGSKYMYVDGHKEEIDPGKGTRMIIKNGRTFLPIRAVIEAMDGEVEWHSSDRKVSIYLNDNKIQLWIGEKEAKVNGSYKESDVAPYISDSNRTMLPLRFIVENLNCEVEWDGLTQQVTITLDN